MDEILEGDISDYFIGLTKPTIDRILKTDNPADVMSLYLFYCYTAKWQKKTVVRATAEFCMKALNIGETRFSNARKVLIALKLIEDIQRKNESGKVVGWYVSVKFFFNGFSGSSTTVENHSLENPPSGQSGDKYYKTGKGNTLKTNSEIQTEDDGDEYIPDQDDSSIVNDKLNPSKAKTKNSENTKSAVQGNDLFTTEDNDGSGARGPSPQEFVARWNSLFVYGIIRELSPGNITSLKARCKDKFFVENWSRALALIQTIPWMMGKGSKEWKLTVKYFLKPDTVYDILNECNESKLPQKKEATVKKKSIDDLRKEVDPAKFKEWLKIEYPYQANEWDQFKCTDAAIKEFLEQTT